MLLMRIWKVMVCEVVLCAGNAMACDTYAEFNPSFFRSAEVIMRAEITGYDLDRTKNVAKITLRAKYFIKGNVNRSVIFWKAQWKYSTYKMNPSWNAPLNVIVGLKPVIDENGNGTISVVQQACGPESLIEDNQENLEKVISIIRDQLPRQ